MADLQAVRSVLSLAPLEWLEPTLRHMPNYGIDTPREEASYLATVGWESTQFTKLVENLYYSNPERLCIVWPSRFTMVRPLGGQSTLALPRYAPDYAKKPEKLAEFVYGGRGGNGPEGSGDGWRYRGRGPGQLTFADNYRAAQDATGHPVFVNPELMLDPEIGSEITCWKWKSGGFDALDDDGDIRAETRRWQGGAEGLEGRQKIMDALLRAMGA